MMKPNAVKSILKKPTAPTNTTGTPTNKSGLGSKIRNIEGNIRMPICGANKDTTVDSSVVEPVVSRMSRLDDGMNNDLVTGGIASTENPNSDMDNDGAGNEDTSGKKDDDECMKNAWENPNMQHMKAANNEVNSQKQTFANVVNGTDTMRNTPKVNFRAMMNPDKVDNSDFVLPMAAVHVVKHKYENSLVGFFVDNVTRVPVWVKLHKVPVVAYSDDGLSLIATQIGKPIMLDAFTSFVCVEAWGRIGYARALIEVGADKELKQEVIMAVPNVDDEGATHTFEKIRVEYEWKPPLCVNCHVFGHTTEQCPKRVLEKPSPIVETDDDGFTRVTNRKSKGNGLSVKTTNKESKPVGKKNSNEEQSNGIKLKNLFEKLNEIYVPVTSESSYGHGVEDIFGDTTKATQFTVDTENKDSDSEVEEVFIEDNPYKSKPKEASTSYDDYSVLGIGREWWVMLTWMQIIMGWNMDIVQVMDLGVHKHAVRGLPWILMGDFNVAVNMEDTYSGSSSMNSTMCEFKDCVLKLRLWMSLVREYNTHGLHNLKALDSNPADLILREEEGAYVQAFNEA
ncbi:trichome birefringence-like protein 3, partial [Tanacetum coccineum]